MDPGGGFDFPYLGRLKVEGLTATEVTALVAAGLKQAKGEVAEVSVAIEASTKR